MTPGIRPLIAGNWKMNGSRASLKEARILGDGYRDGFREQTDALLIPPATLLMAAADTLSGSSVSVGAQDCAIEERGAHTGDLSAEMLADAGASVVVVGHSERRLDHGETDATVRAKAEAAWRGGLVALICVGETRQECDAGMTFDILSRQIGDSIPDAATAQNTVVAYEPVWAIGSGHTPPVAVVAKTHTHIRARLEGKIGTDAAKVRILYGGSVNRSNATELIGVDNVDGALVGRAAMTGEDFLSLLRALFG
jgi:triosephosphate isomerase